MSGVQRFSPDTINDAIPTMVPDAGGGYVCWVNYALLESELAAAREEAAKAWRTATNNLEDLNAAREELAALNLRAAGLSDSVKLLLKQGEAMRKFNEDAIRQALVTHIPRITENKVKCVIGYAKRMTEETAHD